MSLSDHERAAALLKELDARATGLWRVEGVELVQSAFAAAPDMPRSVAERFASATLRVPLIRRELGIVQAALRRGVEVSRVGELPADVGSGYWLRAFGAERSVAVAILDDAGELVGVFSAAIPVDARTDDEVAATVRRLAAR